MRRRRGSLAADSRAKPLRGPGATSAMRGSWRVAPDVVRWGIIFAGTPVVLRVWELEASCPRPGQRDATLGTAGWWTSRRCPVGGGGTAGGGVTAPPASTRGACYHHNSHPASARPLPWTWPFPKGTQGQLRTIHSSQNSARVRTARTARTSHTAGAWRSQHRQLLHHASQALGGHHKQLLHHTSLLEHRETTRTNSYTTSHNHWHNTVSAHIAAMTLSRSEHASSCPMITPP